VARLRITLQIGSLCLSPHLGAAPAGRLHSLARWSVACGRRAFSDGPTLVRVPRAGSQVGHGVAEGLSGTVERSPGETGPMRSGVQLYVDEIDAETALDPAWMGLVRR
jgi:hypothetical protein